MEAALERQGRPKSVALLEVVSVLSVVSSYLMLRGRGVGDLIESLLLVGLALWVTRGRSLVGRRVYTGLLLFGASIFVVVYVRGYIPSGALSPQLLVGFVVELVVLLSLLWWPSTTAWLKEPRDPQND